MLVSEGPLHLPPSRTFHPRLSISDSRTSIEGSGDKNRDVCCPGKGKTWWASPAGLVHKHSTSSGTTSPFRIKPYQNMVTIGQRWSLKVFVSKICYRVLEADEVEAWPYGCNPGRVDGMGGQLPIFVETSAFASRRLSELRMLVEGSLWDSQVLQGAGEKVVKM